MKYSLFFRSARNCLSILILGSVFLSGMPALAQGSNNSGQNTALTPQQEAADEKALQVIEGDLRILTEPGGTLDRLTSPTQQGTQWIKNQFEATRSDQGYVMEYFQNADQMYRSDNPGDYLFFEKVDPLTPPDGIDAQELFNDMIRGDYEEIKGTQSQKDKVCDAVVKIDILANDAYKKADQIVYLAEDLNAPDEAKEIETKNVRRRIAQQRAIAEFFLQKTRRDCLRGKPPIVSTGGILPGIGSAETQQSGNETAGLDYVRDKLLPGIANALLTLSFALGVIGLILIGMMYVMSELNRDLLDRAKEALFWIFIGLIIAILSFGIVKLVLNVNILG